MSSNYNNQRNTKQYSNNPGSPNSGGSSVSPNRMGGSSHYTSHYSGGNDRNKSGNSPTAPSINRKNNQQYTRAPQQDVKLLMIERTLFISVNLIGSEVEVQVRDGSWWEGVLHSCSVDNKFEIILKCARKKLKNDQQNILNFQSIQNIPLFETISISPNQFVQLLAKNINFVDDVTRLSSNSLSSSSDEFLTDTAISKASGELKERELVPWVPDSSDLSSLNKSSKGGGGGGAGGNWDQFKINEKKFGVKTTFNFENYTTHLDRTSDEYRSRESEAESIANSILREQASNVHIAEERGQITNQMINDDEESRYGAVIRTPLPSSSLPSSSPSSTEKKPLSLSSETQGTLTGTTAQTSTDTSSGEKKTEKKVKIRGGEGVAKFTPSHNYVIKKVSTKVSFDTKQNINSLYCSSVAPHRKDAAKISPKWPYGSKTMMDLYAQQDMGGDLYSPSSFPPPMYGGRPAYTPYSPYGSGYPPQYYPPGMPMYTPPVPVFSGYAPPMEYNPYFHHQPGYYAPPPYNHYDHH